MSDNKMSNFIKEHETVWQLIKFTLMSLISGAVEIITYVLLNSVILSSLNSEAFNWWIFNYDGGDAGGLGTMYAFLASTTLAQIIAFIMNRKKTFKSNNNVLFSAIMYTAMVIGIICLQTYTGPIIVTKLNLLIDNPSISGTIGKLIWMLLTFCIVFPMSKFVIMRQKKVKQ